MWSNFYFLVQVQFDDSLSKHQKWRINLHDLLGYFELPQAKGVARKKLRGGPNFATFNVTSFSYYGILPFVNYARR